MLRSAKEESKEQVEKEYSQFVQTLENQTHNTEGIVSC